MSTTADSVSFTNAAPGPLKLKGGRYLFAATATWNGGSVELQGMLPDQASYATVPNVSGTPALIQAPGGFQIVDLPPGQYRLQIITALAVQATVAGVPS